MMMMMMCSARCCSSSSRGLSEKATMMMSRTLLARGRGRRRRRTFHHHHHHQTMTTTTTLRAAAGAGKRTPRSKRAVPVPDNEALPFSTTGNGVDGEGQGGLNDFEKNAEERTSSSFRAGSFNAKSVRLVQWYPGHIARAERLLRDQLKNVDCVVEVRDLRIPLATSHPDVAAWLGNGGNKNNSSGKLHITVLNRSDMVDERERSKWVSYFKHKMKERHVIVTDAKSGRGIEHVKKIALSVAKEVNEKRIQKGLLARPVRTAVVGYPNVGKSALINRLVGKKACASAPRPGVTRDLRWVRVSEEIDLLDSPGVLPPRMSDQDAANRLAMANDIGEASYEASEVAARLFEEMKLLPSWRREKGNIESVVMKRYKMSAKEMEEMNGDMFIEKIAMSTCGGDFERAGTKVLNDFRGGFLGKFCLEVTPAR